VLAAPRNIYRHPVDVARYLPDIVLGASYGIATGRRLAGLGDAVADEKGERIFIRSPWGQRFNFG
jgi:hypothetical protein